MENKNARQKRLILEGLTDQNNKLSDCSFQRENLVKSDKENSEYSSAITELSDFLFRVIKHFGHVSWGWGTAITALSYSNGKNTRKIIKKNQNK